MIAARALRAAAALRTLSQSAPRQPVSLASAAGIRSAAAAARFMATTTPSTTSPLTDAKKAAAAQPRSDAVAKPPAADADADTVPDSFDQAAGLERAEVDYPDIFAHNEVSRGPFGTKSSPALIESAFDERIVGCTGEAAPADHDLHWLTVKKGELCTCPVCGQVFALSPL
ncbi:hypothetical protein BU14_0077s0048 [Porphyra umbilicalis]|uniref:Uncharacterized protein n=1 Tax=Porphyra umbilicalis TaxID=2786 RepID=A0A1X6PF12_PORUM|nr:hypothetical protein BU14_0077s0048 [Porphyra umbilicalis]|eukprot:OSX79429.1 hypothetical protein BU14_0077s0048 [Porphyra umbilicalis]